MKDSLFDRVIAGESNAVARAISKVEDGAEGVSELMKQIFPRTGRALIIGITGAPGAGKSTLVDKLAAHYRQSGERVGIVAVDPSSPFSGAQSWAIAFGCKRCRSTKAFSSGRWRRAETWAGWRAPRLKR